MRVIVRALCCFHEYPHRCRMHAQVPEFLPTSSAFAGAFARDTGHQEGIGAGDTLVLRFDNPTRQVDISTTSAVNSLLLFSSPIGTNYTGAWDAVGPFARSGLTITILEGPPAANAPGAAVGVLQVSVLPAAGLTSLDESTPASNASTVVSLGTWGETPNATVIVRSATSVRVLLSPPRARVQWSVSKYRVQWSRDAGFKNISGVLDVAATAAETGTASIAGLAVNVSVFIRAAAFVVLWYKGEQLSSPTVDVGPYFTVPCATIPSPPHVTDVVVQGGGYLMDARGGQSVAIRGSFLGLAESPEFVAASYSNVNASHTAAACYVSIDGVEITCRTVPGVGYGFTWTVVVDGVSAASPEGATTRFNLPVILDVQRITSGCAPQPGFSAYAYRITGRDFGPAGKNTVDAAWLTLPSDTRATFASPNCTVVTDDTVVVCEQPPGAGTALVWTLEIGYQLSAAPTVTYDIPVIEDIECTPSPCNALNTIGGDTITFFGRNFGPRGVKSVNFIGSTFGGVTMLSAIDQFMLIDCLVVDPGHTVRCGVPSGFGLYYYAIVEVVKQSSQPSASFVSFAIPSIEMVENGAYGDALAVLDNTISTVGRNFGGPAELLVLHNGSSGTVQYAFGPVTPTADHRLLVFSIPLLPRSLVGMQHINVVVNIAGIHSNVMQIGCTPPVLAAHDAVSVEDSQPIACAGVIADWWLVLFGAEFGLDASTTSVVLSSDGQVITRFLVCAVAPGGRQISVGMNATNAGSVSGNVTVCVGELQSSPYFFSLAVLLRDPSVSALVMGGETGTALLLAQTPGGSVVHVIGSGFHTSYTAYLVPRALSSVPMTALTKSELLCCVIDAKSLSFTSFDCTLPAGIDTGLMFVFFARGHFINTSATVGYAPPSVALITIVGGGSWLASAGGPIVLTGRNFGNWSANVTVSVGGRLCVLNAPVTHTHISCTAPYGDAAASVVEVAVASSVFRSSTTGLGYMPPSISFISPNSSMTDGGGTALILGDGFGLLVPPVVSFLLPPPLLSVVASVHGAWTASVLQIVIPAGAGGGDNASWRVGIEVANTAQRVIWPRAFAYDAPYIASVRTLGDCPVEGCDIAIEGGNFATLQLTTPQVAVNGVNCPVVSAVHHEIVCAAPPGAGTHNTVAVTIVERQALSNASFAYDPPEILYTIPSAADQSVTGPLMVIGRNFARAGLVILVSGLPCNAPPVYINSSAVVCPAARYLTIGSVRIGVVVAGQASRDAFVQTGCRETFYGRVEDVVCRACPPHAKCAGYDHDPVSDAGYWGTSRTQYVECIPQAACVGPDPTKNTINQCAPEYTGDQCRMCSHQHFRKNANCVECPDNAVLLVVLFVLLVLVAGAAAAWMHTKMFNLKGLSIGIDMLQTLSMFGSFNFAWPFSLKAVFVAAIVATFSPEITSPECTISFTYAQKWTFMQLSPLFVSGILLLGVVMSTAAQSLRKSTTISFCVAIANVGDVLVGGVFTLLYYTYFTVVKGALEIFACTEDGDGVYRYVRPRTPTCAIHVSRIEFSLYSSI